MKTNILGCAVAAMMALQPVLASADISRGCNAHWQIRMGVQTLTLNTFTARGRCRGKVWANDCRRAARKAAQSCFWSHWGSRFDARVKSGSLKPLHCVGRGNLGVQNYSFKDVKKAIEWTVCARPVGKPITVTLFGKTTGDKRCDGEVLISNYKVTEEMCGKLGF